MKFVDLIFLFSTLGLVRNTIAEDKITIQNPASQKARQDPYSLQSVFGQEVDTRESFEKMSPSEKKIFLEESLRSIIGHAFFNGKVGLASYIQGWAQTSGLSEKAIQSMILSEYANHQMSLNSESLNVGFDKFAATLKGFGLSSGVTRDQFRTFIESGFSESYKSKSLSEKLVLLEKLPLEMRDQVLQNSPALNGHEHDVEIVKWLKKSTSESTQSFLASREIEFCLVSFSVEGCDFRYMQLLDAQKLNPREQCLFVDRIRTIAQNSKIEPQLKVKEAVQKILNQFPTKLNCQYGMRTVEIVPNMALNDFSSATSRAVIPTTLSSLQKIKVTKCGLETSSTIRSFAEILSWYLSSNSKSRSSAITSDNPNCAIFITMDKKKDDSYEIKARGMGYGYTENTGQIAIQNRQALEDYVGTLYLLAQSLDKQNSATASSVLKRALQSSPGKK